MRGHMQFLPREYCTQLAEKVMDGAEGQSRQFHWTGTLHVALAPPIYRFSGGVSYSPLRYVHTLVDLEFAWLGFYVRGTT